MTSLASLAAEWAALKSAETEIALKREMLEKQITALTGVRDEGAKTHDAGRFKVTVTNRLNRKMDWGKWEQLQDRFPDNLRPVRAKWELDDRGVRYLQEHEPELYKILAEAMTVTPAKPHIAVKLATAEVE